MERLEEIPGKGPQEQRHQWLFAVVTVFAVVVEVVSGFVVELVEVEVEAVAVVAVAVEVVA